MLISRLLEELIGKLQLLNPPEIKGRENLTSYV